MRPCTPSRFLKQWPGRLHPVVLQEKGPKLPLGCRRLLKEYGLPVQVNIYCYVDIILKFSGTMTPLADIWHRNVEQGFDIGKFPRKWNRFWHIADQYCPQVGDGCAWVCIEEGTGRLVVIDLNHPQMMYLLNSSVRNFYTTLAYFLEWSERTDGTPDDSAQLLEALRKQKGIPAKELNPFWLNFVNIMTDSDCRNLSITLDRKTAKIPMK